MRHYNSKAFALTAGGGTVNIPCSDPYDHYSIYGSATLAGNWVVQPSGTAYEGQTIWFDYDATITVGVNSVTIFGVALDSQVALKGACRIKCRYNGSAWKVKVLQSFSTTEFIVTAFIKLKNITFALIQDINRGSLIVGDATKRPVELSVGTNVQVLANNGADTFWETPTGDVTKLGAVWTIGANKVHGSMINSDVAGAGLTYNTTTNQLDVTPAATELQTVKITIPTASVLTLNSVPVLAVPSPGAGKAIVVIDAMAGPSPYVSAGYAANTDIDIWTDTADIAQFQGATFLASTKTAMCKLVHQSASAKTQIIADKALYITELTGDPTTGDSNIDVYITYKIVTL